RLPGLGGAAVDHVEGQVGCAGRLSPDEERVAGRLVRDVVGEGAGPGWLAGKLDVGVPGAVVELELEQVVRLARRRGGRADGHAQPAVAVVGGADADVGSWRAGDGIVVAVGDADVRRIQAGVGRVGAGRRAEHDRVGHVAVRGGVVDAGHGNGL